MGQRHKQHMGRSVGDESEIRGRDYAGADLQGLEAERAAEEQELDRKTHHVVTDHELHTSEEAHEESQRRLKGEAGRE